MTEKVLIIGLDCAPPELVFDRWRNDLPTLDRLMARGAYGALRSCDPPITVPAWSSMMTGLDPGELGFYGFRNRADHSYERMVLATSRMVPQRTVWDLLGQAGKASILVGVPQTFPPRPINGAMVTDFLTPGLQSQFTYPPELREEVLRATGGEYLFDVADFRSEDKQRIVAEIYRMTDLQLRAFRHLLETRSWDFAMTVLMGTDRIHHGFWQYCFPEHPLYEPGNPFESVIYDYYRYLDGEIARLLETIADDTVVLVISDHGAVAMDGGICINEWLMREGYLTLLETPAYPMPLEKAEIDWSRTIAWSAGGYYARVFINVQGREPQGIVAPADYERVVNELKGGLEALGDQQGRPIGTVCVKPSEIYRSAKNVPPDLIAYLGNLRWRALGTIGYGTVHRLENDTGPDGANHDYHGIFIAYDPRSPDRGLRLDGLQLMDIAPTVLRLLGVDALTDIQGRTIHIGRLAER